MLRILLVTRSAALVSLIEDALKSEEDMRLIGVAASCTDAVRLVKAQKPELVVLTPKVGDVESAAVVEELMVEAPAPIVVVTRNSDPCSDDRLAAEALSAGALAIVPAPYLGGGEPGSASKRAFLSSLSAMSQVKVVRHWRKRPLARRDQLVQTQAPIIRIVGIAASTGGPAAIKAILERLPPAFPAPILVVQHISNGFIDALASSLNTALPLRVKVAENGEELMPATVYFAPDERQMGLDSRRLIRVAEDAPADGFRPSGSYLFASMAREFGREALAVVLTGMGRDGTGGLKHIHHCKGMVLAQDEASSVVFGMPKAAIESGFVDLVLPLADMAAKIGKLAGVTVR